MLSVLVLSGFFTVSVAACAYADTFEVDPVHSSVQFRVRYTVAHVVGSFDDFSGIIEFDGNDPDATSIQATVNVASVNTRNEERDAHLRSVDFFDTDNFPEAKFVSKTVDVLKRKMVGDLTLRGVTKEVEVSFKYRRLVGSAENLIGGSAVIKIDRRDFGMDYNVKIFNIGYDIEILLEIIAKRSKK